MLKAFITIVDEDTGRPYVENQPIPPDSITEFEACFCTRYRFTFEFVKANTDTIPAILFIETEESEG